MMIMGLERLTVFSPEKQIMVLWLLRMRPPIHNSEVCRLANL